MREILFRGKFTKTGEWVYGSAYCSAEKTIIIEVSETMPTRIEGKYVIPVSVGQYTGLTDKNGERVFEGDICQTKGFPLIDDKPFVVEWNDDECSFYWRDVAGTDEFNIGVSQNTTIIGNIHDNPELLKGE